MTDASPDVKVLEPEAVVTYIGGTGTPGVFIKLGGRWHDYAEDQTAYSFEVIADTADHVDIYDESRGLDVRLEKPVGAGDLVAFQRKHPAGHWLKLYEIFWREV
jgi:hypothetical protein